MTIELCKITLRDLYKDYVNNEEDGIRAYGGKLDVRPPFQREFIYDDKERNAVIETINKGYPLNVMYWSKNEDGTYQLLDGQQRTLSALMYIHGDFSLNYKSFSNLTRDQQDKILNYECFIYICDGTPSEKLDWFKIINIAGEKLLPQELRNSQYTGPWLYDAKKLFSKTNCPAYSIGNKYLTGSPIRQDYLETVLRWICNRNHIEIEDYMDMHRLDNDANELWQYFQNVIGWVKVLFPKYNEKIMKGVDWGCLYNKYENNAYNTNVLQERIDSLILDDEVTNQKGICPYLITGDEKYLNLRDFTQAQKNRAYEKQKGICAICGKHCDINGMEADHIDPWSKGGKTTDDNCQMLCQPCNRRKLAK